MSEEAAERLGANCGAATEGPKRKAKLAACAAALLFALAALVPALITLEFRASCYPDGESTNDTYYHIAMADLGPSAFLAKSFPWIDMSIWKDSFSDKELGFHLYLWGVRGLQEALGVSLGPPFQFAALFVCLLAFGGFAFACWRMGVKAPIAFFGACACLAISTPFIFRAMMLRPHMLSLGLMLASCGLYAKGSLRFRAAAAFAISFVFTWSYSNPHFIVIPALAFGAALYGEFGRKALLIPALAAAGFLAGLIVHPQFPNSLLMWKAQCVDAVLGPIIMDNSPLSKPGEFSKPSTHWLILAIPLIALAYFELMALMKMKERYGLAGIPGHVKALALLAGLFACATLMAVRAIEYACPFICLLGAALAEEWRKGKLPIALPLNPLKGSLLAAAALSAMLALCWVEMKRTPNPPWLPCPGVKAWLDANAPKGSVVLNVSWGDFPMLFYTTRDYRYVWGMDPMFSHAFDSKKAVALDAQCSGRKGPPDSWKLRSLTGADYAVTLSPVLARNLMMAGWKPVHEAPDGWIFALNEKP